MGRKEHFAQVFLCHIYNNTKLNTINSVAGNAEPMPNGEIAARKIIPPKIPNKKKVFFNNTKIPTRIWPKAIKETNSDV